MKTSPCLLILALFLSCMLPLSSSGQDTSPQAGDTPVTLTLRLDDESIAALRNGQSLESMVDKAIQGKLTHIRVVYTPPAIGTNPPNANPTNANPTNANVPGNNTNTPNPTLGAQPASAGQPNPNTPAFNTGGSLADRQNTGSLAWQPPGSRPLAAPSNNGNFSPNGSGFNPQPNNLSPNGRSTITPPQSTTLADANAWPGTRNNSTNVPTGNSTNGIGQPNHNSLLPITNQFGTSQQPGQRNPPQTRTPALGNGQFDSGQGSNGQDRHQQHNHGASSTPPNNNGSYAAENRNPPNGQVEHYFNNQGSPRDTSGATNQKYAPATGTNFDTQYRPQHQQPGNAGTQLAQQRQPRYDNSINAQQTIGQGPSGSPYGAQIPQNQMLANNYNYPPRVSLGFPPSGSWDETPNPAANPQLPAASIGTEDDAKAAKYSKDNGFLYLLVVGSIALNLYLGWISHGFYVRYQELAEELRETFSSNI